MRRFIFSLLAIFSMFNSLAHVALLKPTGGEILHPGEMITISWEILIPHDQENWDLLFSPDGGNTWNVIAEDLPVSQVEYDWLVPSLEIQNARIRIVQDNSDFDYTDESSNFVITSGSSSGSMLTVGLSAIDFDHLEPEQETSVSVPLMNTGSSQLMITGISGLSVPFSVAGPDLPFSIAAGNQQSIQVRFSPEAEGTFTQQLSIESDAANGTVMLDLSGTALIPRSADAGVCYAVTGLKDGGRLLEIDLSDGQATVLADMDEVDLSTAVAVNPSGALFVVNPEFKELLKIDAMDGRMVKVMDLGLDEVSMDFVGEQLFVLGKASGENQQFFSVNISSAGKELIGEVNVRFTGMAYNVGSGQLYGITIEGDLYTIDRSTGLISLVGSTGQSNLTDIAFSSEGTLYGIAGGGKSQNNQLLSISIENGSVIEMIGNTGLTAVSGLTVAQSVVAGFEDGDISDEFTFYPNPGNGPFTFDFGETIPDRVDIVTLSGRVVSVLTPKTSKVEWEAADDRGLPVRNGLYLVRARFGNSSKTFKILVERE